MKTLPAVHAGDTQVSLKEATNKKHSQHEREKLKLGSVRGKGKIRRHAAKRFFPRQTLESEVSHKVMVVVGNGKRRMVVPANVVSRSTKRRRVDTEDTSSLSSCASGSENNDVHNASQQIDSRMPPPSFQEKVPVVDSLPSYTDPPSSVRNNNRTFASPLPSTAATAVTPKSSNVPRHLPTVPRSLENDDSSIKRQQPPKVSPRSARALKTRRTAVPVAEDKSSAPIATEPVVKSVATAPLLKAEPKKAPSTQSKEMSYKKSGPMNTPTANRKPRRDRNLPLYDPDSKFRTETPTTRDVILGRGNGISGHEGNAVFRTYVWCVRDAYKRCSRKSKVKVGRIVCDMVRKQGGRFLVMAQDEDIWVEAHKSKVVEKACQALRENKWDINKKNFLVPISREIVEELNRQVCALDGMAFVMPSVPMIETSSVGKQKSKRQETVKKRVTTTAEKNTVKKKKTSSGNVSRAEPLDDTIFSPVLTGHKHGSSLVSVSSSPEFIAGRNSTPVEKAVHLHLGTGGGNTPSEHSSSVESATSSAKSVTLEVGTRISVYWPLDDTYYEATVLSPSPASKSLHYIKYAADNVTELLDLSRHTFKILPIAPANMGWFPDDELS